MGTKFNLFEIGNLDVTDSLPNMTTENEVEVNYEVAGAELEGQLIEQQVEKDMSGLEDAQDVLEEMKEVIVQHEANVQSMNGQEVGGQAEAPSGEVVAEVPAETEAKVDQNSSNEEVAEQNQDMQQGVESICGRLFNADASKVFQALKINNPYIGAGLNSISGNSVRVAYAEGLEGVKELAAKVWFKIKAMIQSLIQWISKWVHKAMIWIKGYESKAKKLKEEAGKLDAGKKAKEDFQFSPFASLLVMNSKLATGMKELYNDTKTIAGDSGFMVKFANELVNGLKSQPAAGNNSIGLGGRFFGGNLNDGAQQPQDGQNAGGDANANANQGGENKSDNGASSKVLAEAFAKASAGINAQHLNELASNSSIKGTLGKEHFVIGLKNMKAMEVAELKSGFGEVKTVTLFEKDPDKSGVNPKVNGQWAKDTITKICDAITSNISEIKSTLDKGNSAFNKVRNDLFNGAKDSSASSDIGKAVISVSKMTQRALVCAAYLPSYYLNACSEYIKAINGASSGEGEGKKDNTAQGGEQTPKKEGE